MRLVGGGMAKCGLHGMHITGVHCSFNADRECPLASQWLTFSSSSLPSTTQIVRLYLVVRDCLGAFVITEVLQVFGLEVLRRLSLITSSIWNSHK